MLGPPPSRRWLRFATAMYAFLTLNAAFLTVAAIHDGQRLWKVIGWSLATLGWGTQAVSHWRRLRARWSTSEPLPAKAADTSAPHA